MAEKEKEKPINSTCTLTFRMADSSDDNGWHTDPENPMLGPDGQLCDASDMPQQFDYCPSDTGATSLHLHANAEDGIPSVFQEDVSTAQLKCHIKHVI